MYPSGPRLVSRRAFVSAVGAGLILPTACRARAAENALNFRDLGAVGDGVHDDGPTLARALTLSRERALGLFIPAGTYLITDRAIHAGGGYTVPRGATIFGEGPSSVLRFRRSLFPAFYGLEIDQDGSHFRDLTIEVDRNGGGNWVSGVGVISSVADLAFERVTFRGVTGRAGHFGLLPIGADIDGLLFQSCHFEQLDFGFVKQTGDVSTQSRIAVLDCTATDCTEVLEFNSPGLFRGHVSAGSFVIANPVDDGTGSPFDVRKLRPGMEIRSIFFPAGTRVVRIEEGGGIRLSAAALRTNPSRDLARFSAGGCHHGVIRNLIVQRIHQWAVGFARCENWRVEVQGRDVNYELVHIEDGSSHFEVRASGVRCNLLPGVVGSSGADNGMVHVSTGSSDISVSFADADLRGNRNGSPNGLCVQAGGLMGTTGLEIAPSGIRIAGRILMQAGTKAVVAYNSDIAFGDLELVNDPESRASPMMVLSGCNWSGTIRLRYPGTLVAPHARLLGRFRNIVTLAD